MYLFYRKLIWKKMSGGFSGMIISQGLLQSFQYNYELAWNMIKDFYENQGETDIQGSRDAIRLAFKRGLIEDGQIWMDMIKSRILTAYTYNEKTAREVSDDVRNKYYIEFKKLKLKFEKIMDRENSL
jgi:nucleotidyltransferase substrate binding protein (TIGR01987 family)